MTSTTPAEPPERLSLGQPVPVASHIVPISTQGGPSHSAAGTSLVNPVSLALSLPHSSHSVPVSQVDAQALNYLTLEMPHVLRASTRKSAKRRRQGLLQMKEEGFDVDVSELRATNYVTTNVIQACQEIDEEVIKKLEVIGSHVGASFIERLARDRPPFATTLDVLKYICKELWSSIWDKQVDNLRTNHRGVYVLQDNVFKPLLRLSVPNGPNASEELARLTKIQLALPSGILRGALARLGVTSTVVAETNQIPQCTFHIKTSTQKP